MKKSTKSISLVLIGSSVFMAGCSSNDDEDRDRDRPASHVGGHGSFIGTRIGGMRTGGASGARGGTAGAGVSARGGFGGTGAASASS